MNTRKLFNGTFLAGMLLVNALSGAAIAASTAGESCSLFENGKIEKSVLATLLNAAKNGHMYRVQTSTSQIRFCVYQRQNPAIISEKWDFNLSELL